MVEHAYGSLKLYPFFSLHSTIITDQDEDEDEKIDVLLIDYIVEHVQGLEVFIAVHRNGKYKVFVKYYDEKANKKIRKKVIENVGEKVKITDKDELDVFLDHFDIFIVKYLQEIVDKHSDALPDYCIAVIRDILHYLQS